MLSVLYIKNAVFCSINNAECFIESAGGSENG